MMMRKHIALFEVVVQSTDFQRLALLKTLTDKQIRAILEVIYNVLKGTCPIDSKEKKKLNLHKSALRRLVSSDLNLKQRQRLLIKHRDILPSLLKPVLRMFDNA